MFPQFEFLPTELQVKILSFLPQRELLTSVARVSKRFFNLANTPSLWESLFFDGKIQKIEEIIHTINLKNFSRRVTFRDVIDLEIWINLATSNECLKQLDLQYCSLSGDDSDLSKLVELFPNVEKFCNERSDIDNSVIYHVTRWKGLKELRLFNRWYVTRDIYDDIANNCKELQELIIENCFCVNNDSFNTLVTSLGKNIKILSLNHLDKITTGYSALKSCLNLNQLSLNDVTEMKDADLIIFTKLKFLKSLSLSGGKILFSTDFRNVVDRIANSSITYLSISYCPGFNNEMLKYVPQWCPLLTNFVIEPSYLSLSELEFLLTNCKFLQDVRLSGIMCLRKEDVLRVLQTQPSFVRVVLNGLMCVALRT